MYKLIGGDHKEYGPVTADQLRQWIVDGRVNGYSKIQLMGESEWRECRSFPEFASLVVASPALAPAPPPPRPQPMTMPPPPARTNQIAVWALVFGIASLACCQVYLGIVAIVLGITALSKIKLTREGGSGLAIVGIVLGSVALVVLAILLFVIVTSPAVVTDLLNSINNR